MIKAKDIKYVRDITGYSMNTAKAAAQLLDHNNIDIYSDEAAATLNMFHFRLKAERFSDWLKIKELVDEFGPFL